MRILGLSSANQCVSIGLVDEEKVLASVTVAGMQSEKILFFVKEAGILPGAIDGIAVASGPGSYSGLRGSLSAAKTLAQSLGVPLVGVSTLEAIAYNLVEIKGTMAVLFAARADEYNFALFSCSKGVLQRLSPDMVLQFDVLLDRLTAISGGMHIVGDTERLRTRLLQQNYCFASFTHRYPYGINIARLGCLKIMEGKFDDLYLLHPQYSHLPNIREYRKTTFCLQAMQEEDIAAVVKIEKASFVAPKSEAVFRADEHKYRVAKVSDKIIGYIGTETVLNETHIINMAVDPAYRRQGIGEKLVEKIIGGHDNIFLEVRVSNIAAQKLYQKFGFEIVGVRKKYYQDNDEDAFMMKRMLPQSTC